MTKKNSFKNPPPFAQEAKRNKKEIIETITNIIDQTMGNEIYIHEINGATACDGEGEFLIMVKDNLEVSLDLGSLMCPKRVFILCNNLFKHDINIDRCGIAHHLPDGSTLLESEACDKRIECIKNINTSENLKEQDKMEKDFLKNLSTENMPSC